MSDPQHQDPPPPSDLDNEPPRRSRWLGVLIVAFALVVGLGMLNIGRLIIRPKPEVTAADRLVEASPQLQKGRDLVARGGDCMRCHTVELDIVGPGFRNIAKRYAGRDDAVPYLAGKIREGSVGEWGRIVMPRHPQVTQEQAELMAAWLMALGPPKDPAASPP